MKIFVGLSGGVDSAVSAYLLKKAGHDVTGVFLKVWEPDFLPCTSAEDRLFAMRVAAHLEIPFITYDVEKEYKEGVVEYLLNEYKKGRTPNPDVMCNRTVKFGVFWDKAQNDGADAIATGHYAHTAKQDGRYALFRGVDEGKDQSYFLWTLTENDLEHIHFPLGKLTKKEVRAIAEKINLPNAAKKDSQGICFLGHVDMKEFLKRFIPFEKGEVVDVKGQVVGEHDGVHLYTLGEHIPLPLGDRFYVIEKRSSENVLVVSKEPQPNSKETETRISDTSWVGDRPRDGASYEAQIRYHGERYPVTLKDSLVSFSEPVLLSPGQSIVFYKGDQLVGGGIIEA